MTRNLSSTDKEAPAARLPRQHLLGTNLERAGDHNQRVTLQAIRLSGAATRTDLASMTGLTAASITNITRRLLREELILEAGRTRGSLGQPATKLSINLDGCYALGLNIDRDHVTLVVIDFAGRVRARASRTTPFALPDAVRDFFGHSVRHLLTQARIDPDKVVGIGVAFPDDIQRAELHGQPSEYAVWGETSVRELLSGVLPVPVFVENDAAAAAMGELQFGLGLHYQNFFYILITAALGGGVVLDGHYARGATGRSGEVGWLRERGGLPTSRQLQNIVSLSGLYASLAQGGITVASPQDLTRLESGQELITQWIESSAEALDDALVSINCLLNPEAILIGGRLPAVLVDRLTVRLNDRMRAHESSVPALAPIVRAAMSDDASAVGAAILPFSELFLPATQSHSLRIPA
ncbi:MAG TPA: ROK family transcriptional regulator [Steroidobacteraceae bacterium]